MVQKTLTILLTNQMQKLRLGRLRFPALLAVWLFLLLSSWTLKDVFLSSDWPYCPSMTSSLLSSVGPPVEVVGIDKHLLSMNCLYNISSLFRYCTPARCLAPRSVWNRENPHCTSSGRGVWCPLYLP